MQPIDAILSAAAPVMPVVTIADRRDAAPLARALVAGGLKVIEVTLRTSAALEAIAIIAAEVEGAIVGAGTVLTPQDYDAAARAGSVFAISPGSTPALLRRGQLGDIPYLPAVASPSDIMAGMDEGYRRFKFFPAEIAGGPAALKAFSGPFGELQFCPTGGVRANSAADYLALANVPCVGGAWVAPADLVAAKAWDRIQALAAEAAALRPA